MYWCRDWTGSGNPDICALPVTLELVQLFPVSNVLRLVFATHEDSAIHKHPQANNWVALRICARTMLYHDAFKSDLSDKKRLGGIP